MLDNEELKERNLNCLSLLKDHFVRQTITPAPIICKMLRDQELHLENQALQEELKGASRKVMIALQVESFSNTHFVRAKELPKLLCLKFLRRKRSGIRVLTDFEARHRGMLARKSNRSFRERVVILP